MENYNPIKIEKKWQRKWLKENKWQVDLKKSKKPYYNLMMFPYPSAEGLHIGNLYAFIGSDIHGRYMRMRGFDVFEPIGFDAFGIHSENFAIKKEIHPKILIKQSTDTFRKQLQKAGNIYSWNNEVNTTHPEYYKWTQWLFLRLYKAGLAYKKSAPVDWCSGCKTVLASEQVIADKCERCDSKIEVKNLNQWFFKITDYAERLLKNLEKIDWSERTKNSQRNWIGKSVGYRIKFTILSPSHHSTLKLRVASKATEGRSNSQFSIEVFTTRPDTLFGVTYIVLAPEHDLIATLQNYIENWNEVEKYIANTKKYTKEERAREGRTKIGVALKGVWAINPANNEKVPVWISDYVFLEYGTGAIMAVPAHDQRDFEFAISYNLPIRPVIALQINLDQDADLRGAYEGGGILINSEKFNGIDSDEAKDAIGRFVKGKLEVNYHLRDWLISRQRYWGPPIPIIYCKKCFKEGGKEGIDWAVVNGEKVSIIPVPEKDLPVELPFIEEYRPTGTERSPLASIEKFVNVNCPSCGGDAKRETDVSDTFLDSAWYFLRYPSRDAANVPFDKELMQKWLPVDMYIGGQEHAVLHLMYARFITMFLFDQKLIDFEEPFIKFRAHGLLIRNGAKISKSRGNIVNPDEYFDYWGVDTARLYLMFLSPLEDGGDWIDEGIRGVHRFLGRVWGLVQKFEVLNSKSEINSKSQNSNSKNIIENAKNRTIKKVTEDIKRLHYNTAISALMIYVNTLYENDHTEEDIKPLLILLAPLAPYITEELWERLGEKRSIHDQEWPSFDEKFIKEEKIQIPVQINGKVKAQIEVASDASDEALKKEALANDKISVYLKGKELKKVIVVSGKLVNLVLTD